jgi:acetyl-CoA acetyltransferase
MQGRVAIVGVGEVPPGRYEAYSENELAILAIRAALRDAGLSKDAIEGFYGGANGVVSDLLFSAAIAEQLRIEPRAMAEVACGATSGMLALRYAMAEILLGRIETALVFASEKELTVSTGEWNRAMAKSFGEDLPFGPTVPAYYAMVAQRYMFEYGARPEHLAMVAVKNRRHAHLNPHAMFRDPITVEDVLNSRPVATPLRLLDCAPRADGAAALVLVSAERARRLARRPVWITGYGEQHDSSNFMLEKKPLTSFFAAPLAARQAYEMAGRGPDDMDLVEIYEPFTICEIILPEDLGFFPKGEGYRALEAGLTAREGRLPVNTSGGRLSLGHPAFVTGLLMLTYLVRQLRGEAGPAQLPGVRTALAQSEHGMNNGVVVVILEVS